MMMMMIDAQREANLWSLLDIKACFHNFPVVEEQQTQLGLVTQDGLWVHQRMGFGLELAPKWCQYAMDSILSRSGVPAAKGFFDDVTIPGQLHDWRGLWADTLLVLGALTSAGLMIGLKKCKFLVRSVVVLGYQVLEGGYQLATKFLKKWTSLKPPTCLKELQQLLGKFLWCAGFVPEFKKLMEPLEKLLSPANEGRWT